MDLDFEQLICNRDKFKELTLRRPNSIEETKKLLKDIPGIKIEMADETVVKFL
jgi:hypothetical protein